MVGRRRAGYTALYGDSLQGNVWSDLSRFTNRQIYEEDQVTHLTAESGSVNDFPRWLHGIVVRTDGVEQLTGDSG